MADAILTINAGSSSIKFALFTLAPTGLNRIAKGLAEGIGVAPHLRIILGDTVALERRWPEHAAETHEDLMREVLDWVEHHLGNNKLLAAGHRIVHGGADFIAPVRLEADVITRLDALAPLAPLHQPHNLAAVRAVQAVRPALAQVGCFDTAFHHTIPELATRFALPRALHQAGVRRYGFHGLSYEYIAGRLRQMAPHLAERRVIVAHLGNGASLCALKNGVSIETTMGFTTLDGLMMGTRPGSLDPGVLLYLMQSQNMTADAIADLLYHKSGLLGVSGISSDMRLLLESTAREAREAIALFAYAAARQAGALISCLGGLDGLVFTAGIGENAAPIRAAICERLAWTGLKLSSLANAAHEPAISEPDSKVEVRIIPTDEEMMIAHHTLKALG
jgi:acetate kinase